MKKRVAILIMCITAVSALMLTLFALSPVGEKASPSSFRRNFRNNETLVRSAELPLPPGTYYHAGNTDHTIYIGNLGTPFELLSTPTNNPKTSSRHINLINVDSIKNPRSFITTVDSPTFFIANGIMPEIYRGNISDGNAYRFLPDSGHYFVDAIPISKSSLMLKSYSSYSKMQQLAKRSATDTPYFRIKHGILEKQIDGVVDVQGDMHRDTKSAQMIYLYSYRNQFIVMDTNLNVKYRANTIDTFAHAQIKLQTIESRGKTIVASPPTNVNANSFAYDNKLYIRSNLMAKNENLQRFEQESIIDVYDLSNGRYIDSFYIPKYHNKHLIDFVVLHNRIIALYPDGISIYQHSKTKRDPTAISSK